MKFKMKYSKLPAVFVISHFLLPGVTQAQHYQQKNLVSNLAAIATPNPPDPNLKYPWGLTRFSSSPCWVANNNSSTSTLYGSKGNALPPKQNGGPLVVTVPPPGLPLSEARNSSQRKERPLCNSQLRWGAEVAAKPRLEPPALSSTDRTDAEGPYLRAQSLSIEIE